MKTDSTYVLVVDDEPAHAEAVRRALTGAEPTMDVEVVGSLGAFRAAVAARTPSLVLLDLLLPDGRADEVLVAPAESGAFPMVVMTSHGDEQVAVSAIRKGALDYVVKSPAAFADMSRTVDRTLRAWRSMQETRNAQDALRERERVLRMALEVGDIGVYEIDLAPRRATWSPELAAIWGLPPGFSGDLEAHFRAHVHEGDRERAATFLADLLGANEDREIELRIARGDGGVRWLRWRARVTRDDEGASPRMVGIHQDVTERRRVEAALRESEARFRGTLETMLEGCQIISTDWRYRFVNAAAAAHGRTTPEALVGRTMMEVYPDIEATEMFARLRRCMEQREPQHFENEFVHPDGTKSWFQLVFEPIAEGVFILSADLTERKRAEELLRQAQKLEAIGQLAGGVAHDFNNILGALMLTIGFLETNTSLDADAAELVQDLAASAQRAVALTRQLLMFSRRTVVDRKPLDLNEVVGNLLRMLGRLVGEHMRLVLDAQPGFLPSVDADAGMMEQVVMNLVVNARDAMPNGGRITLATSSVEVGPADLGADPRRRAGRYVCLAVTDTGTGMSAETLAHIFEPFFTTKEAGKGTGLGLATVHGIVTQHGGWIDVESDLGVGTTFRVYLPALAVQAGRSTGGAPEQDVPRGHETILVVEDEPALRRGTARTLRALGYRVFEAESGPQALSVWRDHAPTIDLLLTDMVMPDGMSGSELADRLQAEKPTLGVIIASGYSAEILRSGGVGPAGRAYLPKPHSKHMLAEAVRSSLDAR